ncbi:hypothetical protein [Bradyrhizobium sp. STM 3562]|uniref:hypothetical protein n=1 Tax=Bradyrhizobium sp. STM 3562 TaxID=578924 RepID=UPI00388EE4AC
MQHYRAFMLDTATLREDLALMEKQIQFNPNDNDLVNRYLTYARKIREIEYRENGYVTARNESSSNASLERMRRLPEDLAMLLAYLPALIFEAVLEMLSEPPRRADAQSKCDDPEGDHRQGG